MVDREDVDEILADEVERGVGKAVEASASHTSVQNRVGLGLPLDPSEARLDGAKKGLAQSLGPRLVPDLRVFEIELSTTANPDRERHRARS